MSKEIPNFLKRKGDSLLFSLPDKELVYFVPEEYFTSKIAIIQGEYVSLLGLLDYSIRDLKTGKFDKLHPFNFPTIFLCKPYEIEKQKGLQLTSTSEKADYRILKFKEDNEVVTSTKVPQVLDNVEEMLKMIFITAKIPTTVPYDKIWEIFLNNFKLNGGNYNINYQLIMMMISEVCRDPKDLSKPFRLSNQSGMYDYVLQSIKQLPKYVSPFAVIASENWDESIMAGVMMSKDPNKIKNSPMERVLM